LLRDRPCSSHVRSTSLISLFLKSLILIWILTKRIASSERVVHN
jgi:hypothetical protein